MRGIPVADVEGKLGEFLSNLSGSYAYPYDSPIRCDDCAEVISPETPCSVLFGDRFVGESEDTATFRLIRIECEECSPHQLYYDATEYSEFLLMGKFTPELTLHDVHLVDVSSRTDGIQWSPTDVKQIFDPKGKAITGVSPSDLMRILSKNIDPRELVDSDTGELLVSEAEEETVRFLYLVSAAEMDYNDDQVRAVKQSADGDITEADVKRHRRLLRSDVEDLVKEVFL